MEDKRTVRLEMPVSLYERLRDQADGECTSMAAVARWAIDEYCGRFEVPPGPKMGRRKVEAATAE